MVAVTFAGVLLNYSLYKESYNIQETIYLQTKMQSKTEVDKALRHTLASLKAQLKTLSEWDEVHQQFHDPIFYFFWQDERLKNSAYYRKYYDNVELYGTDKQLLIFMATKDYSNASLPGKIGMNNETIIFNDEGDALLVIFEPVKSRHNGETKGYVGIAVNLIQMLLAENEFNYTDTASIHFESQQSFKFNKVFGKLEYRSISRPVNDYLWELVENFIVDLMLLLILLTLMLAVLFKFTIYAPLDKMSTYLKRLKAEPNEQHPIPAGRFLLKEFEELKLSIHDYHKNLQETQRMLDDQNRRVWEQARRDGLSNVLNRRAFDEAWLETINNFVSDRNPVTFVLFDCDFFKALNDTYGHDVGDEVIKLTASTIQKSLPIDATVFRIGGDEFAVIIHNCPLDRGIEIAENTLNELSVAPFNTLGIREKLTFSVGLSVASKQLNNEIVNLPRQADMAMYQAKQSIRNKIQCYDLQIDLESHSLISNQTINTIVDAINTGKNIEMHYQPIVSIDGNSHYYETLLRIRPKTDELIFPKDIFNIVYRRRLEVELDKQVIKQIIQALEQNKIPVNTGLSINISGKTLLQPFFPELFKSLKPYLSNYQIVLEITENSLIDHLDYASEVLNNLRAEGFKIALDDFGSGYSSIRYLANMPVDIIKFDMSMTHALLEKDNKTQEIIRSTAQMVLHAGYDLVMEGIETKQMLELAKDAGATYIQGFLIGKPQKTAKKI